jgi:hypothetical protein
LSASALRRRLRRVVGANAVDDEQRFVGEIEFDPRMRIREPAPISPAAVCTTTPGTRELSASERVLTAAFGIAALSIVAVGAPFSRLRSLCPVAVTVTASRVVAAPDSAKSAVTVEPEVTTTERDWGP